MKIAAMTFLQFVLFFLAFAIGSFLEPVHYVTVVSHTADAMRVFHWGGIVAMALLAALIFIVEAVRGRLGLAGRWTLLALALATSLGLAAKFGFQTISR